MRSAPTGWYETKLMPEKKMNLKNATQWVRTDSERSVKFEECFDYLSDNLPHEDWTVVEDDFVFKNTEDASQFIFTFFD